MERRMKMEKLCVVGGGNGGFAISADMALAGYRVTLYEDEKFAGNLKELFETKTITLTGASRHGDAHLYKVTTDLADAVSDVDVIICSMPAFAQEITAGDFLFYVENPFCRSVHAQYHTMFIQQY